MANHNRKYQPWTTIEDAKLTEALLNMVNTGGYKVENGFKSGYLLHLESVLKETLPDSNILANPHIASRMKTLRKDWQVVFDIHNSSGFGYSKERNCVTADDAVWDAYIEKHPDASKWKNKKFPYFEELCVIFGNDRAQGSKARVAYEMEDEINAEEQQMNDEFNEEMEISHNDPRNIAHVEETSTGRSKKRKNMGEGSKALLETFKDAVVLFSDSLKESSAQLSEGIKLEVELEKKTSMGVSIGPFCSVGSSVVLGSDCKLHPGSHVFGNTKLGDKCILMSGAVVGDNIPGQTIIGCNNVIGHHAVVGVKCQDMKYKEGKECFLQVGDNNEIREHVSIHRSSKPCDTTVIGDNNLIMGSCHIAHDCKVGSNNIFANNTLLAGHVQVEDHAHTAGAIVVHQFCHIGSFCFIGGGSVVSQDVPKYTMVAGDRAELRGLNLEGLRRHGFSVTEVRSLRIAYRKIFMPTNANLGGIEDRLSEVECHEDLSHVPAVLSLVQSIRGSLGEDRRGICKFRSWIFS